MKKLLGILIFSLFIFSVQAQQTSDKLIRQGASMHDRGRYVEAISFYQQALKTNPSSISAVYEMSLSYLKMKDYENAIIHSSKVITVGFRPLLVDAYVVKGTALAAQNNLDEAITLFTKAIGQCGGEYLLLYNLGLCYYNKGSINQSVVQLRKAIEKDTTHAEAFLLYAYALNDMGRWIQSFYSFHFFLLLEPNTKRSTAAFEEMYNLVDRKIEASDERMADEDGINRAMLYNLIQAHKTQSTTTTSRYQFYVDASQEIFSQIGAIQGPQNEGTLWSFFVPVFQEILESGHFDTYCRYVSVSYFPESLKWWEENKDNVDNFIEWFENGNSPDVEEDAFFEGEE